MYGQKKNGGILRLVAFVGILNFVAIPVLTGKPSPVLDKLNLPGISALVAKKAPAEATEAVVAAVQQVAPVLAETADVYTDHNQYTAAGSEQEPVQQELIHIPNDSTENPYSDSKTYSRGTINGY